MAKTVQISNIQGGSPPYTIELIPIGSQTPTSFNDVPNGIFRVKVTDSVGITTLPKIVKIDDSLHVTDRKINWDKIPSFTLPSGLEAVWGAGAPRWLDEGSPTDAMLHGWTATDNNAIDGNELMDAKRQKSVYLSGFSSLLVTAINSVKTAHPSAVYAAIIQEYTLFNQTSSAIEYSYTNYLGVNVNDIVPSPEGSFVEERTIACLFGTEPTDFTYSYNPGVIRMYDPNSVTEDAYVAIGRAYYNLDKFASDGITGNPTLRKAGILFFNEEFIENSGLANQLIFKGMGLEALAQGNPLRIIYCGKQFVNWGGGIYSGRQNENVSWKLKYFPRLSDSIRASAEQLSQYADLNALGDANCVILNAGINFNIPYPSGVKYEKQGNNIIIDQDGERKWRLSQFSEQIRGRNVTFLIDTQNGGWIETDPSYGYTNNRVPEVFWAVVQMYSSISYTIFVNIALAKKYRGNSDIYTPLSDIPVKTGVVLKDQAEGAFPAYSNTARPLTPYQIEFSVLTSFALTEFYEVFTNYLNVRHPNEGAAPVATNKGSGYGSQFFQMSQFEDMTWALCHIKYISDVGDVFGVGNKRFVAYKPADTSNEIIVMGRIKSNKIWVFASEPRLDPSESIVVTLSTNKNGFKKTFKVFHNENFSNVFTLPTGSYEPSDIVFTYKDVYGIEHKVSGDLRSHYVL